MAKKALINRELKRQALAKSLQLNVRQFSLLLMMLMRLKKNVLKHV